DRCVGLDEIVVRTLADHATRGTHDAGGHRLLEAERIADRHHRLTHLDLRRIAERDRGQPGRLDLQQRQVRLGITADHVGSELPAVRELDHDLRGVLDHVVVRDDVAGWVDDEARAHAANAAPGLLLLTVLLEELLERIAPEWALHLNAAFDAPRAYVDDRRLELLGELHPVRRRHWRRGR